MVKTRLELNNPGDHTLTDHAGEDLSMSVPNFMTANAGQPIRDHYAEFAETGAISEDSVLYLKTFRAAQLERFRRSVGDTGLLRTVLTSNRGR